jgi:DNA-directed RNA polymerase subunit RPC12/RpoP
MTESKPGRPQGLERVRMSRVRLGQGGVPDWLEPNVRFCSRCGAELSFGPVSGEERERLACPSCGFVFYVNPRLVVTTLPITERGEVVLIKRGIEPALGMWAQPGGFLEIDETVRDAAVRETLEETGLEVEPGAIVGLYSRVPAAVVVVASRTKRSRRDRSPPTRFRGRRSPSIPASEPCGTGSRGSGRTSLSPTRRSSGVSLAPEIPDHSPGGSCPASGSLAAGNSGAGRKTW